MNREGSSETALVLWSEDIVNGDRTDTNDADNTVSVPDTLSKCSDIELMERVDEIIETAKKMVGVDYTDENDDPTGIVDGDDPTTFPKPVVKTGIKCPKCDLSGMRDRENLRQHIQSMHGNPQKCGRCKVVFIDMQTLHQKEDGIQFN